MTVSIDASHIFGVIPNGLAKKYQKAVKTSEESLYAVFYKNPSAKKGLSFVYHSNLFTKRHQSLLRIVRNPNNPVFQITTFIVSVF